MRCSRTFILVSTLISAALSAGRVTAEERVYLLVFAAQAEPAKPRTSHSFVTVVRAQQDGSDMRHWKIDNYTISWLPATGNIQQFRRPEPGRNFGLAETLRWAEGQSARVTLWGPYEVDPELLVYAQRQIVVLESGRIDYRMLDSLTRPRAVNCIHAVSDMLPGEPMNSGRAFGESASAELVQYLGPWIKNNGRTNDWLLDRLGLSNYPLQRRSLAGTTGVR